VSSYVFAGPTLDSADVSGFGDLTFLPPVEQGNIYALMESGPTAIGIVDGRFHDVPSVWHKEILWALHRGVRVYGAGGMGALRAAELHRFGMRGIGWVFESFRDGMLEDNDEVAVGGRGAAFPLASEPMVDIRRTLEAGCAAGVISDATRVSLTSMAKDLYYPLRTYRSLVQAGRDGGLPAGELLALESWLPDNKVDQLKEDALQMLATMNEDAGSAAGDGSVPDFEFERTSFFDPGHTDSLHWTAIGPATLRYEEKVR
jgi:hypothetical protein